MHPRGSVKKNGMKRNLKNTAPVTVKQGDGQSYAAWIADLKRRYRATQIKAAVAVNSALIEFYWNLGKGVAFLGKEYPVEIGGETKDIDLLFYIVPLHRYLVVEAA